MRVHLPALGLAGEGSLLPAMAECLTASGQHELTAPDSAEVILYAQCHLLGRDWRLDTIARDPIARAWPDKVYTYDERDLPWCRFPGITVSMPAHSFDPRWQVASGYYSSSVPPGVEHMEPDLLFSFVGSPTAPVREAIYRMRHPRGHVERVDGFTFFDPSSTHFAQRKVAFGQLLGRSTFVLCPRGRGVSSIRLYETLASGRIPVILSDEWVPAIGPKWDSFSVRWPESRVEALPRHLESIEAKAPEMSARAREAYDRWFSPQVQVALAVTALEATRARRPLFPSGGIRTRAWRQAMAYDLEVGLRSALGPRMRAARRLARRGTS